MNRYVSSLALLAAFSVAAIAPASAQFGGLLNITGLNQSGGASFAATGAQMGVNVIVGLRSMATAVMFINQAVGNQAAANRLQAVVDELKGLQQPDSAVIERALKTIDANAVDRSTLAKAQDQKSKQQVAQSAGFVAIAVLFDAKAVNNARQLSTLKPGPADAIAVPGLLNTGKVIVTSFPAHIDHVTQYGSMLSTYMSDNKLTPPSKEAQRADAKAQGASAEQIKDILP